MVLLLLLLLLLPFIPVPRGKGDERYRSQYKQSVQPTACTGSLRIPTIFLTARPTRISCMRVCVCVCMQGFFPFFSPHLPTSTPSMRAFFDGFWASQLIKEQPGTNPAARDDDPAGRYGCAIFAPSRFSALRYTAIFSLRACTVVLPRAWHRLRNALPNPAGPSVRVFWHP